MHGSREDGPVPTAAARLAAREPDGHRPLVMRHRWEELLFLHWRVPAERIQKTLPAGLTVDTYNGDAYLGIVPFFMRQVRPIGLPGVRWVSHFHELNVRTYVFDDRGIPGVWFYSLDCDQPLAVVAARVLTGLNYCHAEMDSARDEFIHYGCRRAGTKDVAHYRYRGLGRASQSNPESLEFFLLERYYLYAMRGRSLVRGQVSHAPYEYRGAEVPRYSTVPAIVDGFSEISGPPVHTCFVDGLDVNVYATRAVEAIRTAA